MCHAFSYPIRDPDGWTERGMRTVTVPQGVKESGFAVVYVAHDAHHRSSRKHQILLFHRHVTIALAVLREG